MKSVFKIVGLFLVGCLFACDKPIIREPSSYVKHMTASTASLVIEIKDDDGATIFHSYCTAVWIDNDKLLTAAHCVKGAAELIAEANGQDSEDIVGLDLVGTPIHYIEQNEVSGLGEEPYAMHLGKAVFVDIDHDLALVKALGGSAVPQHDVVSVASILPGVGEKIHIVGHQSGLYFTVLEGSVAAYRDSLPSSDKMGPWLQVQAPIYYGNSGGPVFDDSGELIGIVSMINRTPNVGWAVRGDTIRKFLDKQADDSKTSCNAEDKTCH